MLRQRRCFRKPWYKCLSLFTQKVVILIPDKNTLKPNKTQERKVLIAIKVDSLCSGIVFSTLVVSSSSRFKKCVSLSTDTFPYEEQEILIIKSKTLKNTYNKKKSRMQQGTIFQKTKHMLLEPVSAEVLQRASV